MVSSIVKDYRKYDKDVIEELVGRAKKYDSEALSKLAEHFYPKIYRYVAYKVQNREDVEDITSEVFVRMVKSLKNQKGSFPSWLYRIASNLIIDYYRKNARKKEVPFIEEIEEHSKVATNETDAILLKDSLDKAIGKLTDDQRQVILLKFIEGYTNEEIADIMGKTVGAVKALQFRALNNLKDIIEKKEIND